MSDNPYIKPLKGFNPKNNLVVNEKFRFHASGAAGDTLSDLEGNYDSEVTGDSGKEQYTYKTSDAIVSSIIAVTTGSDKKVLIVSNKAGEIVILSPQSNELRPVKKIQLTGSIVHRPSYYNGILYCSTKEGMLYAIDSGLTGSDWERTRIETIWQQNLKKGVHTAPVATGKILLVAALDSIHIFEAYYQDNTNKAIGKHLNRHMIEGGVVSSPNVDHGVIYIGSESNTLYALEYGGRSLTEIWSYKATGRIRVKPMVSTASGAVIFGTTNGHIYCVDSRKGDYKWSFITKAPCMSNVVSAKISNAEYYFFGADNGIFYCLNSQGKKMWEFKTRGKIRTEALVHNGRVYFGSGDNHFYALDIKTGKKLFVYATDGNINGKPLLLDDVIYFGSTDSFVHGIHT